MGGLIALAGIALYLVPTIVALARHSPRTTAAILINIFVGWTVIGWAAALALALERRPPHASSGAPSPAGSGSTAADDWGLISDRAAASQPPPASQSPRTAQFITWTRDFLRKAHLDGLLDQPTLERLEIELDLVVEDAAAATLAESTQPTRTDRPFAAAAPAPRPEAVPAPPSAWRQSMRSRQQQVAAEFALHGLLYFGVVLTFVGTLGFALFAFSGVNRELRPVAEVLPPAFLFAAAWYLQRRNLPLGASSFELLGGGVTLISLFTSLNDGVPFPPDLHGPGLGYGWAVSALSLLVIYRWYVHLHATSALRFLIAPLGWAAPWSFGMAINDGHFSAWQYPLGAAGVAVSLAIARRDREDQVARATQRAALIGLPLAYALGFVFSFGEHWSPWPLALSTAAVILGSELLEPAIRATPHFPVVQALALGLALPGLAPAWGAARAGLIGVIAAIAVLEWQAARRANPVSRYVLLAALGGALVFTFNDNVLAAGAWGAASLWLHLRTFWRPGVVPGPRVAWITAAAAAPVGFAAALYMAVPHQLAWLTLAVLFALTGALARWRAASELALPFYGWYQPLAAATMLAGTIYERPIRGTFPAIELAAACAAVAIAFVLTPRWAVLGLWGAAAATAWTVQLAFDALPLRGADEVLAWALTWACLGLVATIAALAWRSQRFSGHLLAAAFLASIVGIHDLPRNGRLVVLSIWLATWLIGAIAQELGFASLGWLEPLTDRSKRVGRLIAQLPLVVTLGTIPFLAVELGETLHLFASRGQIGLSTSVIALAYGIAAARLAARRPLAPIVAFGAVAVGVVGISVAAPEVIPSILAVTLAIAAIFAIGGRLRRPFMTWLGWALSAVLAILIAHELGVALDNLHEVLLGWSAACLLGGLAYDDLRHGRRTVGQGVRESWVLRPVVLGAIGLPAGLSFSLTAGTQVYGWWMLGAACLYFVLSWQLRAGAISAVGWGLASFAAAVLLPWDMWQHPPFWLPLAALLLLISFGLSTLPRSTSWWLRWDAAPAVIAHIVAAVALARSTAIGSVDLTWTGFGVLAFTVAAWKRHWGWLFGGIVLLLTGASQASPGWLAASLGITAAVLAVFATRHPPPWRWITQCASAAVGAWGWIELLQWLALRPLEQTELTVAAALPSMLVCISLWRRIDLRAWLWPVLGFASLQSLMAAVISASLWPDRSGLVATLGLLGIESAGLGFVLRRSSIAACSPALLCASWLLFATQGLARGDIEWVTVPLGITILAMVDISRAARKPGVFEPVPRELLLVLDYSGMAFVCGAALIQAVVSDVLYAVLAVAWGLAIACWALLTRVRRRMQAGVGIATLSLVLLLVVPLARLLPHFTGIALWATLAGIGAALLVIAATMEQSRARVGAAVRRASELMEDWE